MAENNEILTWQQKMDRGLPLNPLDEVKADADFAHRERLREREARERFEARKRGSLSEPESNDGDLADLSMADLRARADELGVAKNGTKEALIARIEEAENNEENE